MILFDSKGRMVSTFNESDLHKFAQSIGLKKSWYQYNKRYPHYDLTTLKMIKKAISAGASQVSTKLLVKLAWWNKESL